MILKKICKVLVTLLIIAILFILSAGLMAANYNQPADNFSKEEVFFIEKGESLNSVAARLKSADIIRSALLLKLICKVLGTEKQIKAGHYTLPSSASTIDIHNILLLGQDKQEKITIPEGWTLKKIAGLLEEYSIVRSDDFLAAASDKDLLAEYDIPGNSFEGYLFPDTYFYSEDMEGKIVVKRMVDNFFRNLQEIVSENSEYSPQQIFDTLIMASIIEREYRVAEEAVLIASVFYNRLKYGMGLESCATLEYIITDILGKPHPGFITLADKEIDSLYNTYKWHGLPPGPISNPGKVALHAAFYPAKTDYWFFLLKDPEVGSHYFSKDFKEHIQAKAYYLKGYGRAP